jgi:hypothetical protein
LNIPNIPPVDTKNIPIARTEWGGLNKPSNPNIVCHKKSNGPAVICNIAPTNTSFNAKGINEFFLKISVKVNNFLLYLFFII